MKTYPSPSSRGFTLVELLIVIVIIVVLVAVTSAALFRFRKYSERILVTGNLRQIQAANAMYAAENNGKFVPPTANVDGVDYLWFENPYFVSQIKGETATFLSGGVADTSLPISCMDPSVVKTRPAGYKTLGASYGYTTPANALPLVQAQIIDSSRSAAFITASAPFADFASKANIAYRHSEKAIVVFYDGHTENLFLSDISDKPADDPFWPTVNLAAP